MDLNFCMKVQTSWSVLLDLSYGFPFHGRGCSPHPPTSDQVTRIFTQRWQLEVFVYSWIGCLDVSIACLKVKSLFVTRHGCCSVCDLQNNLLLSLLMILSPMSECKCEIKCNAFNKKRNIAVIGPQNS